MEQLIEIVIKRLGAKGMDDAMIPAYIRDVANAGLYTDFEINELSRRLQILGWDEVELDYHTFELIEAIIENECFSNRMGIKECMEIKDCSIPLLFQNSAPLNLL